MKMAIFIIACLVIMVLSTSVFAKSDDQIGGNSSVTEAVYGKGELLK